MDREVVAVGDTEGQAGHTTQVTPKGEEVSWARSLRTVVPNLLAPGTDFMEDNFFMDLG